MLELEWLSGSDPLILSSRQLRPKGHERLIRDHTVLMGRSRIVSSLSLVYHEIRSEVSRFIVQWSDFFVSCFSSLLIFILLFLCIFICSHHSHSNLCLSISLSVSLSLFLIPPVSVFFSLSLSLSLPPSPFFLVMDLFTQPSLALL